METKLVCMALKIPLIEDVLLGKDRQRAFKFFMQDLTKFRKENRSEFLKDFKIIYAKKEVIIYEIGSLVVVVNLASNPIYIDNVVQPSIDEENKIFGEGRAVSTDLGTIVDKNSYLVFKKEKVIIL